MSLTVSYASGVSDKPLLGVPISQLFDQIVDQFAKREAVVSIHQNTRLNYSQLAERVNELAKAIKNGRSTPGVKQTNEGHPNTFDKRLLALFPVLKE